MAMDSPEALTAQHAILYKYRGQLEGQFPLLWPAVAKGKGRRAG